MSDSEEKTPIVSLDQGTGGDPVAPKGEGAAAKMKQITKNQTSHQESARAGIQSFPQKPPWWHDMLFVEDPIKEYKKDMAVIGLDPYHDAAPPPLPLSGFEDEIDFVYSMWLKDEVDCDVIDLPYEALEAMAKQQTKILKECKERVAKAKEDGDVNYELEYIHLKKLELLLKKTQTQIDKM